eukprot:1747483-Prymnesium_polylepis.1
MTLHPRCPGRRSGVSPGTWMFGTEFRRHIVVCLRVSREALALAQVPCVRAARLCYKVHAERRLSSQSSVTSMLSARTDNPEAKIHVGFISAGGGVGPELAPLPRRLALEAARDVDDPWFCNVGGGRGAGCCMYQALCDVTGASSPADLVGVRSL